MHKRRIALLCSAFLISGASFASASALTFDIVVNTAPLISNSAAPFYLDFQLNGSGPNTAVVSNLTGATAVGAGSTFGQASGDLNTSVALNDSSGSSFNEFYQQFTAGTLLRFTVSVSNVLTATPDLFAFSILDHNLNNIPTSGLGDSLAYLTLGTGTSYRDVRVFRGLAPPGEPDFSGVNAAAAAPVPEPASVWLCLGGLLSLLAWRRVGRRTGRTA